jgi:hypothetical protein
MHLSRDPGPFGRRGKRPLLIAFMFQTQRSIL